jgi:hypothetical protein
VGYRCEAKSAEGFVQQVANYVAAGYRYAVSGTIPGRKDPRAIDRKLMGQYGVNISKWARARRKKAGGANVHYLRHGQFFVFLISPGSHPILEHEPNVKDLRRSPLRFQGYSIGCGKGVDGRFHASVRIHLDEYRRVKAYLLSLAVHRSADLLTMEFKRLPYVPYARVRRQLLDLLRAVNRQRQLAGYEVIPLSVLRLRRVPVKVFADDAKGDVDAAA